MLNNCPNCKHKPRYPMSEYDDVISESWYYDDNNVLHTIFVCAKCEHFCDLEGSFNPLNWFSNGKPMKINYVSEMDFDSYEGEFMGVKFPEDVIKRFNNKIKAKKNNVISSLLIFVEESIKLLKPDNFIEIIQKSFFYEEDCKSGAIDGAYAPIEWILEYFMGSIIFAEDYANVNKNQIEDIFELIDKKLKSKKIKLEKSLPPNKDGDDFDIYEPIDIISHLTLLNKRDFRHVDNENLIDSGKEIFKSFFNQKLNKEEAFKSLNGSIILACKQLNQN
jgi:hypothetical protein